MDLAKFSTAIGVIVTICTIAITFGIQMERLDRLREDVAELKRQQVEISKAIGQMEHRTWRRGGGRDGRQ